MQQNFADVSSQCANEFIVYVRFITAIKQDKGLKGGMIYLGSQFPRAQSIATEHLCLGGTSQRRVHRRGPFSFSMADRQEGSRHIARLKPSASHLHLLGFTSQSPHSLPK